MTKRQKKALSLGVKLVVAAGLLGWVLSKVHWRDYVVDAGGAEYAVLEVHPDWERPQTLRVASGRPWARVEANRPASDFVVPGQSDALRQPGLKATLESARLGLFPIVLAGYVVSLSVIGVRWWFLLRIQEIVLRPWEVQRLTFLGQFFNTVVPGTVGGDFLKAYYVARHTPRKAGAIVSIFVDRVLGFAELAMLAGVMLLVVWLGGLARLEQVRTAGVAVLICLGGVAGALVFLLVPAFRRVFRLEKIYQRLPIAHHFAAAGDAADLYRRRLGGLLKAILMTLGAQVIWICSIGLLGRALNLSTPFHIYLVFVPVIYLCAAFIPSPGGVGTTEFFYWYFLASGGFCSASEALALALLARLMDIARGLPGLWVVVTGPKLPKASEMAAMETGEGPDPTGAA